MLPFSHVSWKLPWSDSVRQDQTHQSLPVPPTRAVQAGGPYHDLDVLCWQRAPRKLFLCAATRYSRFADNRRVIALMPRLVMCPVSAQNAAKW